MTPQRTYKKGISLIEIVVYVSLFTVISVVAVSILLSTANLFMRSRVKRTVTRQGTGAMERIIREVRLSYDVDTAASTFDVHPGSLTIRTLTSPGGSATTTRRFFIQNNALMLQEGVSPSRALTSKVRITGLIFRNIVSSTISRAIKTELIIEGGSGQFNTQEKFYGTAVLRGSYP